MAKITEFEKRIIDLERQIKEITDNRFKETDLQILRHDLIAETNKEINEQITLMKAERTRSANLRISIISVIITLLGLFGFTSIFFVLKESIFEKVSNQLITEGRIQRDSIIRLDTKYRKNLRIIDQIERKIAKGKDILELSDQSSASVKSKFAAWKYEVTTFVDNLDLPKNVSWWKDGRKMSQLRANIANIHELEGDNMIGSINQTISTLQGYIDELKTSINLNEASNK